MIIYSSPKFLQAFSKIQSAITKPVYKTSLIIYDYKQVYFFYYIQVSQEECVRLREGVPYGKVHRYNPKHLCPKLNSYGDNSQRKV
jgi:hypothetical protein